MNDYADSFGGYERLVHILHFCPRPYRGKRWSANHFKSLSFISFQYWTLCLSLPVRPYCLRAARPFMRSLSSMSTMNMIVPFGRLAGNGGRIGKKMPDPVPASGLFLASGVGALGVIIRIIKGWQNARTMRQTENTCAFSHIGLSLIQMSAVGRRKGARCHHGTLAIESEASFRRSSRSSRSLSWRSAWPYPLRREREHRRHEGRYGHGRPHEDRRFGHGRRSLPVQLQGRLEP